MQNFVGPTLHVGHREITEYADIYDYLFLINRVDSTSQ